MIITVTPYVVPAGQNSVAPFALAGWDPVTNQPSGRCGPSGLKVREARSGQVVQLFRSPTIANFDRFNRQVRLSFEVWRVFATLGAAQTFLLQHAALCPTSGLVTITAETDSGAYPVFYLPSSTINAVEGDHQGASARHFYQVTAPGISTTSP